MQHQRTGEAAQAVCAEQASGGLCSAARSEGMQWLEARRRASPAMRSQGETRAAVSTGVECARRLQQGCLRLSLAAAVASSVHARCVVASRRAANLVTVSYHIGKSARDARG